MISPYNDEYFMKQAFQEAQKAFDIGEVPVGAVVVCKGQIIARAHNLTEQLNDLGSYVSDALGTQPVPVNNDASKNFNGGFQDSW